MAGHPYAGGFVRAVSRPYNRLDLNLDVSLAMDFLQLLFGFVAGEQLD